MNVEKMITKGLTKDFENLKTELPEVVSSIELVDDCLKNWNVTIIGPKDSPYEGGFFVVNIDFSDCYPFKYPKLQFKTKIFHLNIDNANGRICDCTHGLDKYWVPSLGAKIVIESVISFM